MVLVIQDEAHQLLAALGVRLAELAARLPDLGALDLQMLDVPYVGSHAQLGATWGAEEELELRARQQLLFRVDEQTVRAEIADRGADRNPQIARYASGRGRADHNGQSRLTSRSACAFAAPVHQQLGAIGHQGGRQASTSAQNAEVMPSMENGVAATRNETSEPKRRAPPNARSMASWNDGRIASPASVIT